MTKYPGNTYRIPLPIHWVESNDMEFFKQFAKKIVSSYILLSSIFLFYAAFFVRYITLGEYIFRDAT